MKKKCPACQHDYEDTHRVCPFCGTPNSSFRSNDQMVRLHPVISFRLFLIGFFVFNIIGFLISFIFSAYATGAFGANKTAANNFLNDVRIDMFVNTISYCAIFVILLFAARTSIPQLIKSFVMKNGYIAGLVGMAAIYLFGVLYGLLLDVLKIGITSNTNQQSLDSVVKLFPVISLIVFAIIGPICEELTYRVGLFSFLHHRSRVLAYVLTIVIFSFIHFTVTSFEALLNEVLNLPFYAFTAFVLCYLYEHYGFAASTFTHVLNNTLSILIEVAK